MLFFWLNFFSKFLSLCCVEISRLVHTYILIIPFRAKSTFDNYNPILNFLNFKSFQHI